MSGKLGGGAGTGTLAETLGAGPESFARAGSGLAGKSGADPEADVRRGRDPKVKGTQGPGPGCWWGMLGWSQKVFGGARGAVRVWS